MTPFEQLVKSAISLDFNLWGLVKILFLMALAIYVAFATIVVRQVGLMTRALNVNFEILLRVVAWLHLLVALGVFFLAMVTL